MKHKANDDGIDESVQLGKDEVVILPEQARYITTTRGKRGGQQLRSTLEPLAFYFSKRQISKAQLKAGKRLFGMWSSSAFGERYATMRFTDEPKTGDAQDRALFAQEYFDACKAITSEFDRKTVLRVCCGGEFSGRGKRFASLISGLDDLVKHFHIEN